MSKLTALEVKNLSQPGRYGDGDGLYLRIAPGGSKQWIQRILIDSQRRDLGLGGFPSITLAEARRLAVANKAEAKANGQVKRERKARISASATPTFRELAHDFHSQKSSTWKNQKTGKNWIQRTDKYVPTDDW